MSLRRSEATEAHFREIAADFVLATFGIAALPSVAPNEQRRFTEGKIPLYPPLPKGEDAGSLL